MDIDVAAAISVIVGEGVELIEGIGMKMGVAAAATVVTVGSSVGVGVGVGVPWQATNPKLTQKPIQSAPILFICRPLLHIAGSWLPVRYFGPGFSRHMD